MAYFSTHNYAGLALECPVQYWHWCDEVVGSVTEKTENQAGWHWACQDIGTLCDSAPGLGLIDPIN